MLRVVPPPPSALPAPPKEWLTVKSKSKAWIIQHRSEISVELCTLCKSNYFFVQEKETHQLHQLYYLCECIENELDEKLTNEKLTSSEIYDLMSNTSDLEFTLLVGFFVNKSADH